jgi:hypothetical protein
MLLGKARPKLALSFSTRRIRLGITHNGTASAWAAPVKDVPAERSKPHKKRR